MRALVRMIEALIRDRRGATVVEYGFILALIVLALMVSLTEVATTTTGMWNNVSTKVRATN